MSKLDGKVALVTGAGSPTGIGMGCVHALCAAGAKVALTATSKDRAESRAETVRAGGAQAIGIAADVRDETSIQRMVEETVQRFGRLDILVNNAAAGTAMERDGSVTKLHVDAWDETMA